MNTITNVGSMDATEEHINVNPADLSKQLHLMMLQFAKGGAYRKNSAGRCIHHDESKKAKEPICSLGLRHVLSLCYWTCCKNAHEWRYMTNNTVNGRRVHSIIRQPI